MPRTGSDMGANRAVDSEANASLVGVDRPDQEAISAQKLCKLLK